VLQPLLDVDLSDDTFPYATTQLVTVAGHLCRAVRFSSVGELGWELHIPSDSCLPVYKAVWTEGLKHGLRHAGYRALTCLSSEKGMQILRLSQQPSALLKIQVCWNMMPCHLVSSGGAFKIWRAACTATQWYVPEDLNLQC